MGEVSEAVITLVRMYVILSRVKVLKPSVAEFIKMCNDVGVGPDKLIGYIDIKPGGVITVNNDGEEFLKRIQELMRLGVTTHG